MFVQEILKLAQSDASHPPSHQSHIQGDTPAPAQTSASWAWRASRGGQGGGCQHVIGQGCFSAETQMASGASPSWKPPLGQDLHLSCAPMEPQGGCPAPSSACTLASLDPSSFILSRCIAWGPGTGDGQTTGGSPLLYLLVKGDRRVDSPAWSGRGSRPSWRTSGGGRSHEDI